MALFDTLLAEVYHITRRPDLVAQTEQAISMAVVKAHNADEWRPDKLEVVVTPTVVEDNSLLQINTQSTPFLRHKKTLAVTDYPVTRSLDRIELTNLFNEFYGVKTGVFYEAGFNLNLLDSQLKQAKVAYLQKPDSGRLTLASWIATNHSEVIVHKAAAIVYQAIGAKEEQRTWEAYYQEGVLELQRTYVEV